MEVIAKMIKLIAVDMDGTFLNNHQDYDRKRFLDVYLKLKDKGILFGVASGNQYFQIKSFFPGLDHELFYVAENGAMVLYKNDIMRLDVIDPLSVTHIHELLSIHPEVHAIQCTPSMAYLLKNDPQISIAKHYYHQLSEIEDFKLIHEPTLKFNLNFPSETTGHYFELFSSLLKDKAKVVSSGHGNLDIIAHTTSKATGLACLCDHLNIQASQVLVFGDGGNDVEMLKWAGHSFAMENAPQNIQEVAQGICPSNQDQGVLTILEKLVVDQKAFNPILETSRLILRAFQASDLLSFLAYRCDPEIARYQSWGVYNLAKALKFIDWAIHTDVTSESSQLAIQHKETQEHIGDVYLHHHEKHITLGYSLAQVHQKQGYMFELLTALIQTLRTSSSKVIHAETDPNNQASIKLLLKLGFHLVDVKDGYPIYLLK